MREIEVRWLVVEFLGPRAKKGDIADACFRRLLPGNGDQIGALIKCRYVAFGNDVSGQKARGVTYPATDFQDLHVVRHGQQGEPLRRGRLIDLVEQPIAPKRALFFTQ